LLLIFKKGSFFILNLSEGRISSLVTFKVSFFETLLISLPFLARISRKGVRCGIKVTNDLALFVFGNKIYELDLTNGHISEGFSTSDHSRPLTFSKIEGVNGFLDGIYFGGYKGNPDKTPISIFRRTLPDQWDEVFQFPPDSIEHIHNIVADPYKNIVYILTGDFAHSAGIWMTDNGFKTVVPLLIGDQKYRACVAFATSDGLVYATDSPFHYNSIRLLKQNDNSWESIHLMDINGPAIYGCQWSNDFIFSTSVEPNGQKQDFWYKLFGRTQGEGIIENSSFIYKGNLKDGFEIIYKVKKDIFPFFIFQFGVLIFPSGLNNSLVLPVFHIATKRNGMNTILLKKKIN